MTRSLPAVPYNRLDALGLAGKMRKSTPKVARPLLAAIVLLGGACAAPIDDKRIDALRPIADEVSAAELESNVRALVAAHRSDTAFDCSKIHGAADLEATGRPVCALTREKARELVRQRFEELGLATRVESQDDPSFPTTNVIAELRGVSKPDEVVLIGAHYDAFHAGADDNSSGVSVMLEAARVLSKRRFARTIRFVGFDLEEFGLVGSTRHVLAGGGDKVVQSIVLDCIGFATHEAGSQSSPLGFPVPDVGDFVGVIANEASADGAVEFRRIASRLGLAKVVGALAPGHGGYDRTSDLLRSDHAPFWMAGSVALFVTDTANFRNPNYHTDTDTPETLDWVFLGSAGKLVTSSIAYWAEVAP